MKHILHIYSNEFSIIEMQIKWNSDEHIFDMSCRFIKNDARCIGNERIMYCKRITNATFEDST